MRQDDRRPCGSPEAKSRLRAYSAQQNHGRKISSPRKTSPSMGSFISDVGGIVNLVGALPLCVEENGYDNLSGTTKTAVIVGRKFTKTWTYIAPDYPETMGCMSKGIPIGQPTEVNLRNNQYMYM
ncbi:hypothetical protein BDZ91DRAFT_841369, partial [Kalaharituber pfeilii]